MCIEAIKRLFQKPVDPQPLYPNAADFSRLTIDQVIEELEYDIVIHESYAVWVVQDPGRYPPASFGDYIWHLRWIAVYKSAILYLKELEFPSQS